MFLFSRNFVKIKPSRNGVIILSVTDEVANFNVANMSFNAIRENKILTKLCEFTVYVTGCVNKCVCYSVRFELLKI